MVWPEPGTAASMPTRTTMATDSVGTRPSRSKRKKKKTRQRLETIGLALALVVVGSLIAYLVWPPGAAYLFRHADRLMASQDSLDWIRAREEYLDPLDRRFPEHPYKEQTEAWRDPAYAERARVT